MYIYVYIYIYIFIMRYNGICNVPSSGRNTWSKWLVIAKHMAKEGCPIGKHPEMGGEVAKIHMKNHIGSKQLPCGYKHSTGKGINQIFPDSWMELRERSFSGWWKMEKLQHSSILPSKAPFQGDFPAAVGFEGTPVRHWRCPLVVGYAELRWIEMDIHCTWRFAGRIVSWNPIYLVDECRWYQQDSFQLNPPYVYVLGNTIL